jgi:hypothetical protein
LLKQIEQRQLQEGTVQDEPGEQPSSTPEGNLSIMKGLRVFHLTERSDLVHKATYLPHCLSKRARTDFVASGVLVILAMALVQAARP